MIAFRVIQFLELSLRSAFKLLRWFGKPNQLSPLECARYGWSNTDIDQLQCSSCLTVLSAEIHPDLDEESEHLVIEKLHEALRTSHALTCPWRDSPSPVTFSEPLSEIRVAKASFVTRIKQLMSIGHSLPILSHSHSHSHRLNDVLTWLQITEKLVVGKEFDESCVVLALCGWAVESCLDENKVFLQCELCQRHICMSLFASLLLPSQSTIEELSAIPSNSDSNNLNSSGSSSRNNNNSTTNADNSASNTAASQDLEPQLQQTSSFEEAVNQTLSAQGSLLSNVLPVFQRQQNENSQTRSSQSRFGVAAQHSHRFNPYGFNFSKARALTSAPTTARLTKIMNAKPTETTTLSSSKTSHQTGAKFHPVEEHRSFCFWSRKDSADNLIQLLLNSGRNQSQSTSTSTPSAYPASITKFINDVFDS